MTEMNALVKYPCKEVTTKFGKKLTVVFQTDKGEQLTKWGNLNDTQLQELKPNQRVSLTQDGNKLIVIPLSRIETTVQKQEIKEERFKNTLLKKTEELAKHYDDCDKVVRANITGYKTEDSIRAITTTVFLQSIRG